MEKTETVAIPVNLEENVIARIQQVFRQVEQEAKAKAASRFKSLSGERSVLLGERKSLQSELDLESTSKKRRKEISDRLDILNSMLTDIEKNMSAKIKGLKTVPFFSEAEIKQHIEDFKKNFPQFKDVDIAPIDDPIKRLENQEKIAKLERQQRLAENKLARMTGADEQKFLEEKKALLTQQETIFLKQEEVRQEIAKQRKALTSGGVKEPGAKKKRPFFPEEKIELEQNITGLEQSLVGLQQEFGNIDQKVDEMVLARAKALADQQGKIKSIANKVKLHKVIEEITTEKGFSIIASHTAAINEAQVELQNKVTEDLRTLTKSLNSQKKQLQNVTGRLAKSRAKKVSLETQILKLKPEDTSTREALIAQVEKIDAEIRSYLQRVAIRNRKYEEILKKYSQRVGFARRKGLNVGTHDIQLDKLKSEQKITRENIQRDAELSAVNEQLLVAKGVDKRTRDLAKANKELDIEANASIEAVKTRLDDAYNVEKVAYSKLRQALLKRRQLQRQRKALPAVDRNTDADIQQMQQAALDANRKALSQSRETITEGIKEYRRAAKNKERLEKLATSRVSVSQQAGRNVNEQLEALDKFRRKTNTELERRKLQRNQDTVAEAQAEAQNVAKEAERIKKQREADLRRTRNQQKSGQSLRSKRASNAAMIAASSSVGLFGAAGFPMLNIAFAGLSGGIPGLAIAAITTAMGEGARAVNNFTLQAQQAAKSLGAVSTSFKEAEARLQAIRAGVGAVGNLGERLRNEATTKFYEENLANLLEMSKASERLKDAFTKTKFSFGKDLLNFPFGTLKTLTGPGQIWKLLTEGPIEAAPGAKFAREFFNNKEDFSTRRILDEAVEQRRKMRMELFPQNRTIESDPYEIWKRIQETLMDPMKIEEMRIARETLRKYDQFIEQLKQIEENTRKGREPIFPNRNDNRSPQAPVPSPWPFEFF